MNLLRSITEIVDKDVAANPHPISSIAAVIPVVLFAIFDDGGPTDSYPLLFGLAIVVGATWFFFVEYRVLLWLKKESDAAGKKPGSVRMAIAAAGLGILLLTGLISALTN